MKDTYYALLPQSLQCGGILQTTNEVSKLFPYLVFILKVV